MKILNTSYLEEKSIEAVETNLFQSQSNPQHKTREEVVHSPCQRPSSIIHSRETGVNSKGKLPTFTPLSIHTVCHNSCLNFSRLFLSIRFLFFSPLFQESWYIDRESLSEARGGQVQRDKWSIYRPLNINKRSLNLLTRQCIINDFSCNRIQSSFQFLSFRTIDPSYGETNKHWCVVYYRSVRETIIFLEIITRNRYTRQFLRSFSIVTT